MAAAGGLLGDVLGAYPGGNGTAAEPRWLEDWFQRSTERLFSGEDLPSLSDTPEVAGVGAIASTTGVARLLSVQPHFFRGFRVLAEPITLSTQLLVIEGANSSGKTSLAEALEWQFTGTLSRRDLRGQGYPRELERCVGNQFRPAGEETWVETVLERADGSRLTVRRVLVEDYGSAQSSRCASRVLLDGGPLDAAAADALMEELFAGCPPLLMQHTLRRFVYSEPSDRRRYFEQLLRLDELTQVVEKAVIGDGRLREFPSPTGSAALRRWEAFKQELKTPEAKSRVRQVERRPAEEMAEALRAALPCIAHSELGIGDPGLSYAELHEVLTAEQRTARQQSFPLLAELRPKRVLDDPTTRLFDIETLREQLAVVHVARTRLDLAEQSASDITDAQFAVARAVAQLTEAGLIPAEAEGDSTCPVCEYPELATLKEERLGTIRTWEPVRAAVQRSRDELQRAASQLVAALRDVLRARRELVPASLAAERWETALEGADTGILSASMAFREQASREGALLDRLEAKLTGVGRLLGAGPPGQAELETAAHDFEALSLLIPEVPGAALRYASALASLEQAVGARVSVVADYVRRDALLAVGEASDALASDIAWELAKVTTQKALQRGREALIAVRQSLLASRRSSFSDGITEIWKTLRAEERYSSFGQLVIPDPRGKGYPIEIQVKARLDDGTRVEEVDALRVFSDSQVNALGIAAFVTRAKLLGHRVAILDDPVQSMDEEHFRTFATRLLPHLLDIGFQVLILTHNDSFARDVSYAHHEREDYATVRMMHSRRRGCRVDYDNRRVRERLARARRLGEDGDVENGWKVVRLAIERLYVLTRLKHGASGFNPSSWVDHAAEGMFEQGVREIMARMVPDRMKEMKEILSMTAAGAHDKAPRGLTDLQSAIAYVRDTAKELQIAD